MNIKIYLTSIGLCLSCALLYAQCEKDISTNQLNPVNDEFLPLKNNWYPNHPTNPVPYTVNSFLNTSMNWSPGTSIILDLTAGWSSDFGIAGNYIMRNPFANNHHSNHLNSSPRAPGSAADRDWRWADGWELLWMNIGKYPNGDPYNSPSPGTYFATGNAIENPGNPVILDNIAPPNVPYFVLYNRYRGVVRLFANVWQNNLSPDFQEWSVTMKYTNDDVEDNNLSGLFRHASSIDLPLDQPSESFQLVGPRTQWINSSDWAIAEFQMAFDPCICMKEYNGANTPGRIEFEFVRIETINIDMLSRTIETVNELDSITMNEDFLNLSAIDSINYRPGTVMYTRMDSMLSKYQLQLKKYNEEMNDYNEGWNNAKRSLLDIGKNFVTSGINLAIPAGSLFTDVLKAEGIFAGAESGNKITNNAIKGIIGTGVDYASFELFGKKPNKPMKPSAPVASFSETSYRGTLKKETSQKTSALFIPGGITAFENIVNQDTTIRYGYGKTEIYPSIFPAYNKVLGTSALLKTPGSQFHYRSDYILNTMSIQETEHQHGSASNPILVYECQIGKEIVGITNFKLKLDNLEMAINRNLDFDLEKTRTFIRIEIQMKNKVPPIETWYLNPSPGLFSNTELPASNMHLSHEFPVNEDGYRRVYSSKWIPIAEVNQYLYSLNVYDASFYSGEAVSSTPGTCDLIAPFDPSLVVQELESVKMKILQDNYFQQIGHFEEQVNTTQVTSYYLYNAKENINHLGDQSNWGDTELGVFDLYIPGLLTIGTEHITTTHPLVHEIIGNEIFINAQSIDIRGKITVESGYTLVIQALEQIKQSPGATFNPKIHMRIKKDFYSTRVFEYADNAAVYNFCNDDRAYQANTPSKSLQARIQQEIAENAQKEPYVAKTKETTLSIYPNPARTELTIKTQGAGIDQLTIFDMATRPVMQASPGGQTLHRMDIGSLAPGVYIIRATCGDEVLTEKLVVAK